MTREKTGAGGGRVDAPSVRDEASKRCNARERVAASRAMQSTGGTRATGDDALGAAQPLAAADWGAAGSVATADARDPTSHHDRCRDGWWGVGGVTRELRRRRPMRGGGRDWVVGPRAQPPSRRRGWRGRKPWARGRTNRGPCDLVGFQGRKKKVEKYRQEHSRPSEHRQRFTTTMRCVSLRLSIAHARDATRRFRALDQSAGCFPDTGVRVPPSPLRIEGDGIFVSKMNSFDTTRLPDHRGRTAGEQVQHLCGAYTEIPIWATSAHLAVRWWPPREPPRAHSWPSGAVVRGAHDSLPGFTPLYHRHELVSSFLSRSCQRAARRCTSPTCRRLSGPGGEAFVALRAAGRPDQVPKTAHPRPGVRRPLLLLSPLDAP